jgi:signal transduction histidine kinase
VFDELNQPKTLVFRPAGGASTMARNDADGLERQRLNTLGKVADLKLDDLYQKKSEDIERKEEDEIRDALTASPARSKRREQIALPESVSPADDQTVVNGPIDLRISTFESEVDPLEFSLLDSGHFVLFRKVWRDGNRYIQGILIDQGAFVADVIDARYRETAVAGMSKLIVAFRDDVIHSVSRRATGISYSNSREDFDGALLYRNRLSAPLDGLELIFSITRLPPGPGASVLGWVTLVLAIVFVGGFFTLYRLGLSQINLARQQQDFVSAVSHELKTPLTSIRMYGEMLREGWADEEKRQSYYEFIHDEAERLTRLISNVLQLAKITRNESQFDIKSINVGELMSNIDSKISSQVKRAGFELRFERNDQADRAMINVDEDCFAQIVINLVDNAIKFSKDADKKLITLSSRLIGNSEVMFAVRDYGPGVPKEQMKKIFKLFYRSESELTRETVGTGIGLAIVHQLSVAMGGKVDVVNVDPGAEFRVTFAAS